MDNEYIKTHIGSVITEIIGTHGANLKNSSTGTYSILQKIDTLIGELQVDESTMEQINLFRFCEGIVENYMYIQGMRDSMMLHCYFDKEFIMKDMIYTGFEDIED